MQPYTVLTEMFAHADPWGEETVIRDVAKRAGVLWECGNPRCGLDNAREKSACEHCSWPAPEPDLRPGEWRCLCMASNWDGHTCHACHREKTLATS